MKPEADVHAIGGVAATHELLARGHSSRSLSAAVASGALIRVRQGWYCLPTTAPHLIAAFRVGGHLTCVSGARELGLLVRNTDQLHVAVTPHGSRLRSPDDTQVRLSECDDPSVVVHWGHHRFSGTRFVGSALECVIAMAHCQSLERTVAAADSALREGHFSRRQWLRAVEEMPLRLRRLLRSADGRSESITESLARFRLQQLGLDPRIQVKISGVGRVDLMIGQRLVIEVDGRAYHSEADDFENDRRRDARLSAKGYRVLRFSYRQVMEHWSEVKAAILSAVQRGDHLA